MLSDGVHINAELPARLDKGTFCSVDVATASRCFEHVLIMTAHYVER